MTPKLLFVSNLFPDASEPSRGIYNARLAHHLAERTEVRVLAPRIMPFYKRGTPRAPRPEDEHLRPLLLRSPYLPKVGTRFNPLVMATTLREPLRRLHAEERFSAILVSWIYPDACAIARLADELGLPFVAVAQGSDIHQYLDIRARRPIILDALGRARAVVTRSQALADQLVDAGLGRGKVHVLYNGVEHHRFRPGDRAAERAELGWRDSDRVILYVGNFVTVKNPHLLIDAFLRLRGVPGAKLVMVGDGPMLAEARARVAGTGSRVELLGRRKEDEVARMMRAADVLCVPSDNEGVPNVVLEAFASGLPVVATRVGGIPEVIPDERLGLLVPRRDLTAMTSALERVLGAAPATGAILEHARRFSWPTTADRYLELFGDTLSPKPRGPHR